MKSRNLLGEQLAKEAMQCINHDRQNQYGAPEDSFSDIAYRWTKFLQNRYKASFTLTGKDVAFMMMELKMARESVKHKRDNVVDLFGYGMLYDGR